MATTALFVEILVMGALAEVWIGTAILCLADTVNLSDIAATATALGQLTTLLAVPLLALTYALGWIINFVSERLFKPFFQARVRNQFFDGSAVSYYEAKNLVLHKGSTQLISDILFDRHIIRIARSNVVNFTFISATLLLHLSPANRKIIFLCVAISIILALISFAQWLTRYRSLYQSISDVAKMLLSDNE